MSKRSSKSPSTRFDFLDEAKLTVKDRGQQYGTPHDNFTRTAEIWSAMLDVEVTAQQVAMCLIGLKLARLSYDPDAEDGWIDVAGYAACGGEVAKSQ